MSEEGDKAKKGRKEGGKCELIQRFVSFVEKLVMHFVLLHPTHSKTRTNIWEIV